MGVSTRDVRVTSDDRTAFLAGESPEDVHIYIHEERLSDPDALASHGERLEDGIALVLDGETARTVFADATGIDPMTLAREAMATEGVVARDCTDGECPADKSHDSDHDDNHDDDEGHHADHQPTLIFAFAEAENEEVGGRYAEGTVIHAYVACSCGQRYSDRWVAEADTA